MLERLSLHQKEIHQRAVYLGRRHRALEAELIATLREVATEQIHKRLEYTSLVKYAMSELGLNEAVAVAFVTVAHKSEKIVEFATAIHKGELTVSTASRMTSVISEENARELIEFAKSHTHREINLKVASINPKKPHRAHVKSVAGDRVRLSVDLPTRTLANIERAQDLLSSRKHCDKNEAIDTVFAGWLESNDPILKAERAQVREFKRAARVSRESEIGASGQERAENGTSETADVKSCSNRIFEINTAAAKVTEMRALTAYVEGRVPIPAAIKHAVALRDRCQCTFVDSLGRRCDNRRQLHFHHILQVSLGGTNELSNLTTICATHHELIHQLSLPIEGQVSWVRERIEDYIHACEKRGAI